VFARTGATTGKSFLIAECPEDAVFASYLIRVRLRDGADPRFVRRFFETSDYWAQITRTARGVAQPGVNATALKGLRIPLPSVSEQRRIAEILDKADALRAKRRTSLAQLDTFTQALFLDMFGDSRADGQQWPVTRFLELLALPLRNGLSPSHSGSFAAEVLTLSAITGSFFDPEARKSSTFESRPGPDQSVRDEDFLICRGNGNLHLVGKGDFPSRRMPDVTFPDTMIAARPSRERIEPLFLEHLWNSTAVRSQIESLARTTNGTFKVNQTMV
jgi:type I restriction enzyme, S subunit